jgi:hypothetical protein
MTPKCGVKLNRIVNEAESNAERFHHFLSVTPNFLPYAIALPAFAGDDDRHAGSSYPTALSTSIVRCTAGRAIIRA